jgi:hypothetical protein
MDPAAREARDHEHGTAWVAIARTDGGVFGESSSAQAGPSFRLAGALRRSVARLVALTCSRSASSWSTWGRAPSSPCSATTPSAPPSASSACPTFAPTPSPMASARSWPAGKLPLRVPAPRARLAPTAPDQPVTPLKTGGSPQRIRLTIRGKLHMKEDKLAFVARHGRSSAGRS